MYQIMQFCIITINQIYEAISLFVSECYFF